MGYYTDFSLSIKTDVNKDLIGDESSEKRVINYISSLEDDHYLKAFLQDGEFYSTANMKWYDCETDMKNFSTAVPDVLFELSGEGEDDDDRWRAYFLNGKMQMCIAKITIKYPEFDMDKMK